MSTRRHNFLPQSHTHANRHTCAPCQMHTHMHTLHTRTNAYTTHTNTHTHAHTHIKRPFEYQMCCDEDSLAGASGIVKQECLSAAAPASLPSGVVLSTRRGSASRTSRAPWLLRASCRTLRCFLRCLRCLWTQDGLQLGRLALQWYCRVPNGITHIHTHIHTRAHTHTHTRTHIHIMNHDVQEPDILKNLCVGQ